MIFFNREPVAEDMQQWEKLYYVGADAQESGTMQGEIAADVIKKNPQSDRNKDGKIQYVVLEGEPGHQDTIIRTENAVEALKANGIELEKKNPQSDRNKDGKIQYVVLEGEPGHQDTIIRTENAVEALKANGIELEKLSYGLANWNRAQAENRMSQMISQYQTKIELVLANNDEMALGAIDAYEKLNYTESTLPLFFGIDGTDVGLKAVRESKLDGTVYNDKKGQAEAMAKLAAALASGEGMDEIPFENQKYLYLPYAKVLE